MDDVSLRPPSEAKIRIWALPSCGFGIIWSQSAQYHGWSYSFKFPPIHLSEPIMGRARLSINLSENWKLGHKPVIKNYVKWWKTIFGKNVWPMSHQLTWRVLRPVLQPATRGRLRYFGFIFGELSFCLFLCTVNGMHWSIVCLCGCISFDSMLFLQVSVFLCSADLHCSVFPQLSKLVSEQPVTYPE